MTAEDVIKKFDLVDPKYPNKWLPALRVLAELFDQAYDQHDQAIAVQTYRTVAAVLPLIDRAIDQDIADAEEVLERASHLPKETPAVVELCDRHEDCFRVKKILCAGAWGMDYRMTQRGLVHDCGGHC